LPKVPDSYNEGEKVAKIMTKGDTIRVPETSTSNVNIREYEDDMDLIDFISTDSITAKGLDNWYKSKPKEEQYIEPEGKLYETSLAILSNVKDKERAEKAIEFFLNNLSKVLFIYMPIFAFWLWLFHSKKKRYYFDSGIFTLHFFSVLLLSITICQILSCIFGWINCASYSIWLWVFMFLYITFYFFRGSRKFFEERRLISHPKSFILIGINNVFILLILTMYGIFTIYKVYS